MERRRSWWTLPVLLTAMLGIPARAEAQAADGWKVDLYPLYFWAMSLTGDISTRPGTVPIDLDFSDAKENLGGAFSFHFEASRGRWGTLVDLNFIRLSTDADFTIVNQAIGGDFELDNVLFEAGASYVVDQGSALAIIGGLRTYTISPKIAFATAAGGAAPVDGSVTSPNAFVGLTLRPQLAEKWTFIGRGDVGGGDANLTWSAQAGLDYRFRPWGSLAFGYKGLGVDVDYDDKIVRKYDVVHHGPYVALGLHWGER